ncbi:related to alcohol dehydrogenase, class IV [Cephalotrichum gorgonifer]|uniref:Related to alcohol dehydrogenase, class IV n=1 Tax=Cephalotrichum gorgonifer TaxID=2041049 RepID=A0AAE8T0C0_9PEZI|nr:related to alcohol dehydrogenase, class IV [Cephalotrichum gorgonifer]
MDDEQLATFDYVGAPYRVTFGKGTLTQLPSLVSKLGAKAVMVLSTPEQAELAQRVEDLLGDTAVSKFTGAAMHTPTQVTEKAVAQAMLAGVDGIVSVGGGSTIGLGKAISIRTGLPHLCVPTTGGISESARYKALYGAWLCGICLGAVDMALHHKLCHTLGGSFNLPHAETHVSMLPHALAYNAPNTPLAMAALAGALPGSEGDAVRGINALYDRLGLSVSLESLGMPEDGISKAADIATSNPYQNPRPLERDGLRELIRRAWHGEQASLDI